MKPFFDCRFLRLLDLRNSPSQFETDFLLAALDEVSLDVSFDVDDLPLLADSESNSKSPILWDPVEIEKFSASSYSRGSSLTLLSLSK